MVRCWRSIKLHREPLFILFNYHFSINLSVFIDEYSASMNEALKNETIFQNPTNTKKRNIIQKKQYHHWRKGKIDLMKIRSKIACCKGITYVLQAGIIPIVMVEFTSGFNISSGLALLGEYWEYGQNTSKSSFQSIYVTKYLLEDKHHQKQC